MVGDKLNRLALAIMTMPYRKSIPVTLSQGAVVRVMADPVDGTRLVDVERDSDVVKMFAVDLKERGTPLV